VFCVAGSRSLGVPGTGKSCELDPPGEIAVGVSAEDGDGAIPLNGFSLARVGGLKTEGPRLDISTTLDGCGRGVFARGLGDGICATEVLGTGNLFSVCESRMEG
jgi:hypothetical protein